MNAPIQTIPCANRRTILRLAGCAGLLPLLGFAQGKTEYPTKPIRFVVPAPPGGGTDVVTRQIGNALSTSLGWTVVVENNPGAGGNIGLDRVVKAPKDGYTIAMGESSNLTVNQFLYKNIPFAIEKDLIPVSLIAKVPLVLLASGKGAHQSVANLVEASKSKPLTFASSGNGTLGHLAGELWKKTSGLDLLHVPYRGAAPAMSDLSGGHVDLFFASITAALASIQSGLVRALAVTTAERASALPDVPTMAEAGYPDIEAAVIFGVVAPTGTPQEVVARLNQELNAALQQASLRRALLDLGAIPESLGGSVETFADVLHEERLKWGEVVKASGATVD
ncbi:MULTISPECIES: Bug family tripartite tricarboxylate transporter substrate binding protein [unclassified Brenneria]|uniref:Bug family tripartite tricarboxylate transporter substrate binding protein n=1 Tax=unclassified Brenneria TaxID=2634434 RepID=UPI0018F105B0|nr:tripartite tricarboxylate transporter substrate binding protein [Brenneria sp. L3-3C-1]MBJ7223528.1 tripartite tricarboxylate transporter substrate binding protein [Brenneria sp. L3-3C-1]MEE3644769.1 tripartite tricarboxylate transporter substrate binding protein [Brenneria sp. L3_3C_1]